MKIDLVYDFLDFFSKGYSVVKYEPLISRLFPTSFTSSAGPSAGLEMLSPDFQSRYPQKSCVVQPCIRYWDLECIGDPTHLSFFQMGALISFERNDRKNLLSQMFDYILDMLQINKSRIFGTYYEDGLVFKSFQFETDFEGRNILLEIGLCKDNIIGVNGADGFVANVVEPFGGYKLELYVDLIGKNGCSNCKPSFCTCDRFLELVTTINYQYLVNKTNHTIKKLENFHFNAVGFGLERLEMLLSKTEKIYSTFQINSVYGSIKYLAFEKAMFITDNQLLTIAEILRPLIFLYNEKVDTELIGSKNRGRRWVLNKFINKLLVNCEFNLDYLEQPYNSVCSIYGKHYELRKDFEGFINWIQCYKINKIVIEYV